MYDIVNEHWKKPKGQSRMYNPNTRATLSANKQKTQKITTMSPVQYTISVRLAYKNK